MPKRALKTRIAAEQEGECALTGVPLDSNTALIDTDRLVPKAEGGVYTDDNTRIVEPRAHMARHGTLRERADALDELKTLVDDRIQVMKLKLKINNQLLAFSRRTDKPHPETQAFLETQRDAIDAILNDRTRRVEKAILAYRVHDPLVHAALNVPNLGALTVAMLTIYIDFHKMVCDRCHHLVRPATVVDTDGDKTLYCKCSGEITLMHAANTVSSLWKYVGLHCASGDRYQKGEAGGGNKTLRCALWNVAVSMMKDVRSPYRTVYDRTKARLAASEKETKTRDTQGRLVTAMWKDVKPGHRHGAALRAMMKHLLADYWFVGRALAGLPTRALYVEEQLGHTGIVRPEERGWKW